MVEEIGEARLLRAIGKRKVFTVVVCRVGREVERSTLSPAGWGRIGLLSLRRHGRSCGEETWVGAAIGDREKESGEKNNGVWKEKGGKKGRFPYP